MGEKKTKAELIKELESLRYRVAQLEAQNGDHQGTVEAGQKSRELFESLARATKDAIWVWDLETDHVWRSEGMRTLGGYDPKEIDSDSTWWMDRIHPDDRDTVVSKFDAHVAGGGHLWSAEYRFARADGSYAYVSDSGYVVRDDHGKPVRMIGVNTDITKRKRAEAELRTSRDQLRHLASHLLSVREDERSLIAREMHDELGQVLTGLKLDLSWFAKRLSEGQEPLLAKTQSMSVLLDSMIQSVRKLSTELRPGVLDDLGLSAAIEWQVQEFAERTGIRCEVRADVDADRLDRAVSTSVFRIVQEALTNIARHADATRVSIRLQEAAGELVLEVQDNGRGISDQEATNLESVGLHGMRERARLLGGTASIWGQPEKGTTVHIGIPMNR